MENMLTYVEQYRNADFTQMPFNIIDSLILSQLSYYNYSKSPFVRKEFSIPVSVFYQNCIPENILNHTMTTDGDRVLIEALKSHQYGFLRVNYPNGDMVGHTGSLPATICSMEALDLALARLYKVCKDEGYIMLVTADHGNADEMLEKNKKGQIQVRTAHSLNKVPFIESVMLRTPMILRPKSNKRTGMFEEREDNPAEGFNGNPNVF